MKCASCRKSEAVPTTWDKVRSWFLRHLFPQDLIDEKAGSHTQGFADGHRYGVLAERERTQNTIRALQDEIERLRTSAAVLPLTAAVKTTDVIETHDGKVWLGGEEITGPESQQLQEEALHLKEMRLWSVLTNTTAHKAVDKAVLKSTTWEENLAGKLMLHTIGIFRSIVDVLAGLHVDK